MRKNDFIRHIKQLNIGDQFNSLDNDSDQYWHNVTVTAFKSVHSKWNSVAIFIDTKRINHRCFSRRLFDVNFDGFIDKKEFRWMTTSELVSWKTIDLVFEVGTFLSATHR